MPLDLDLYLARIGYDGPLRSDLETLCALHLAHITHIPFENLDVVLGRPVRLDEESLQTKMVKARRGGCCFEQNTLFAAVLEQIGFKITRLSARVLFRNGPVFPRTHMLLMAEIAGERWIGDVGFGGPGLMEPIRLVPDQPNHQYGWTMQLRREAEQWMLHWAESPSGGDQYAFTLDPQLPVDFEPGCHYCARHPDSRFMSTVGVQLPAKDVRYVLHNNQFIIFTGAGKQVETIDSNDGVLRVLEERFGLSFPAGTIFGPADEAIRALRGSSSPS